MKTMLDFSELQEEEEESASHQLPGVRHRGEQPQRRSFEVHGAGGNGLFWVFWKNNNTDTFAYSDSLGNQSKVSL